MISEKTGQHDRFFSYISLEWLALEWTMCYNDETLRYENVFEW